MFNLQEIKRSLLVSIWFVFLTFPIMVIRVNSIEKTIQWRWINILYIAVGSFLLSMLFRYAMKRKELQAGDKETGGDDTGQSYHS